MVLRMKWRINGDYATNDVILLCLRGKMTRVLDNYYVNRRLMDGYDYKNQAWVQDGKYIRCGHPENMNCECYGRLHEGEETDIPEVPFNDRY